MLSGTWKELLETDLASERMLELKSFLLLEQISHKEIYPPFSKIFNALYLCSFEDTKVVIIGQDPYHGPNQAHGLSFSVESGEIPPSLLNIYKELQAEFDWPNIPKTGNLTPWAKQGVLLLNNVLTVEKGQAGSHRKKGWEEFTDLIIKELNDRKENLVFILWGRDAQTKGANIDKSKHLVLESVHPSPLSAHRGFFGSKPFSKANAYLKEHGHAPINWSIKNI